MKPNSVAISVAPLAKNIFQTVPTGCCEIAQHIPYGHHTKFCCEGSGGDNPMIPNFSDPHCGHECNSQRQDWFPVSSTSNSSDSPISPEKAYLRICMPRHGIVLLNVFSLHIGRWAGKQQQNYRAGTTLQMQADLQGYGAGPDAGRQSIGFRARNLQQGCNRPQNRKRRLCKPPYRSL